MRPLILSSHLFLVFLINIQDFAGLGYDAMYFGKYCRRFGKTALSTFRVNMTLVHRICEQHSPLKQ
jgi:hypothetical protein